ncbi:MAG TPA: FCD domain-containing protein [Nocardioides sp.]|jgi:DNA-binding FadR family transcriptional regulator|uniref:FadR/GntR family transcriptional regulator n=1 Tax=Nocardioides sp. TaxID=35761 RepID=UPI002E358358|nr:FCD domain-containing protein [Nocardioides sp.]HEX3930844.1 FCD domain-containing protein [Nocardioides sp.]
METTLGDVQLSYDLPRRESRAESAAQAVEQRIADAGLQPGTRLGTRTELGELLDVAPSTVSETIKLLEARGRVVTRTGPGGGVFVAEPGVGLRLARSMMQVSGSEVEVAYALEVRDVLESAVIVSAAEAAHRPGDLASMNRAMQALREATETAEFYRRNLEFHADVADLCRNPILRTIYRSLLEVVQARDPKLELLPGQNASRLRAQRTKIHQDVADAITQGDTVAARTAAIAHAKHGHATPAAQFA